MDVRQAISLRRTVRAYAQDPVSDELLAELVSVARLAPSAANLQPLEYVAINEPGLRAQIFECLRWAAYTHPVGTPGPGQEPTAYLVVLVRPEYKSPVGWDYDVGASIMSAMLLAVEKGLGSCWIKAVNAPKVAQILGVPPELSVDSVLALGKPAETPTVVDLEPGQSGREVIRYWREPDGRHLVPKRALADILHRQRWGLGAS